MMNQKEIVAKLAVKEMAVAPNWRGTCLNDLYKFKLDTMSKEERDASPSISVLEKLKKYPNHILTGKTWTDIGRGVLCMDDLFKQIVSFYNSTYEEWLEELKKEKNSCKEPVFIVTESPELDSGKLYPAIVDYSKGRKCIVLLINK